MSGGGGLALACLALLATASAPAHAADEPVSVIVTFQHRVDVDVEELARTSRTRSQARRRIVEALKARAALSGGAARALLRAAGVSDVEPLWLINGLAVTAPPRVVGALARLPGVARVEPDIRLRAPGPGDRDPAARPWNLDEVGAPALWGAGHRGAGVVVAGIDTGVDLQHPDLVERWRGGSNSWLDTTGEHDVPHDPHGHGTQTMGLMVGGDASGEPIGVAPGARWIAVKIYDDSGEAALSDVHRGLQWLLDPDGDPATDDAPDVINASWGFSEAVNQCVPSLEEELVALRAAGIAVVLSAGNAGPMELSSVSPANYESAFSVGAANDEGRVPPFSSRGPSACTGGLYPTLAAPGVAVRTADLTFGGVVPAPWATVSGTSFASAHVAGAFALLRGAFPGASLSDLEGALTAAAVDIEAQGPDLASGQGLVDVAGAYALLGGEPLCADHDGDGHPAAPGCGAPPDCDDADPSIHPGARERLRDGVDQDCNGFDLTVTRLDWRARFVRRAWLPD